VDKAGLGWCIQLSVSGGGRIGGWCFDDFVVDTSTSSASGEASDLLVGRDDLFPAVTGFRRREANAQRRHIVFMTGTRSLYVHGCFRNDTTSPTSRTPGAAEAPSNSEWEPVHGSLKPRRPRWRQRPWLLRSGHGCYDRPAAEAMAATIRPWLLRSGHGCYDRPAAEAMAATIRPWLLRSPGGRGL
jgi:hypothetical protein